ncbi:MAG: alpha/beta hydrolase [Bacteroidota bacterium]
MAEPMSYKDLRQEILQLYRQGRLAAALELIERHAAELPERFGIITFWRMCLLSLCGRAGDVLEAFRQALDQGMWWHERSFLDPDLDAVRDLPEFKRLAAISHQKYLAARADMRPERRLLTPEELSKPVPLLIFLHGRNANAETDVARWEPAREAGWMVLLPQSSQPLSPYAFCWDDPNQGLADIEFHYEEIARNYAIDTGHVVLAGFSQGSGMALLAALSGKTPARGFIGIGTWWQSVDEIAASASEKRDVRAYFIIGEKDQALQRSHEIENALRLGHVPVAEETHPDIGHEFPVDFETSFQRAIAFLFEEAE